MTKNKLIQNNISLSRFSISSDLAYYLHTLKIYPRNEVYETVCLMILNTNYLEQLESLIINNKKSFKISKKNFKVEIKSSQEYRDAVNIVCKSSYFIKMFTPQVIERKRNIALNIIQEIVSQIAMKTVAKNNDLILNPIIRFQETIYPSICHEIYKENGVNKIKLIFNEETPLDELHGYLQDILEVKNYPKKKKLTLGKSIRILQVENQIRKNPKNYKREPGVYMEQLIAREMKKIYKEDLSMELIGKSLTRIKVIRQQINAIEDK